MDTQLHAWPSGLPLTSSALNWLNQPTLDQLNLLAAHSVSRGRGVTVAVLDTGADASQPLLAGHLDPGWNYVSDTANTSDVPDAGGSSAVGHGTFVSGMVALVAPEARIVPLRVLDGDGRGTLFGAAQAIDDSIDVGAKVINLSFGTTNLKSSQLLKDAIDEADKAGVTVVAAAGNDANNQPHWPAAQAEVVSVAALSADGANLASFSDYGGWIDVAAPGDQIVGPMPGGGFATWSGTSIAAPVVAGQAALIIGQQPSIRQNKVEEAIQHSARALRGNPVHFGAIDLTGSLAYARSHP